MDGLAKSSSSNNNNMIGPVGLVGEHIVRLRGVPWSCSKEDIIKFFSDCNIRSGHEGIHFMNNPETGKPSGEAYVEFETPEDIEKAKKHNMQYIGTRYIEVFDASRSEMLHFLNRTNGDKTNGLPPPKRGRFGRGPRNGNGSFPPFGGTMPYFQDASDDIFIRLRGLPYNCKIEDLEGFFYGIEIAPNGIKMPLDEQKRSVGEAFIQFATIADANKAMDRHKEKIGHRYIEVFRSSAKEFYNVYVEGWYPAQPPLRPPGPGGPWMDGFGPRGPGGPFGCPRPSFGGPRFGGPPPPRNPYDFRPPPPGRDPYYNQYWSRDQYDSPGPGPMRSRGPAPFRQGPYDRPMGGGSTSYGNYSLPPIPRSPPPRDNPPTSSVSTGSNHFVFVRGLPFHVREIDINQFFHVKPTHVKLIMDDFGRPTEAKVEFASHQDAVKAMEKDKAVLFDRAVDLFLCSKDTLGGANLTSKSSTIDASNRPPMFEKESSQNGSSQMYSSGYSSYNAPSASSNGSSTKDVQPSPATQVTDSSEATKTYSYYGMVPPGYSSQYSVPSAQTSTYNYTGYSSNPYYSAYGQQPQAGYGSYSGYSNTGYGSGYTYTSQTSTNTTATTASATLRKDPVNYPSWANK